MCRIQLKKKQQFSFLKAEDHRQNQVTETEEGASRCPISRHGSRYKVLRCLTLDRFLLLLPTPSPSSSPLPLGYNTASMRTGNQCWVQPWCCRKETGRVSSATTLPLPWPANSWRERAKDGQCAPAFALAESRAVGWTMQEHQTLPLIQTPWWKHGGPSHQLQGGCPVVEWLFFALGTRHFSLKIQLKSSPNSSFLKELFRLTRELFHKCPAWLQWWMHCSDGQNPYVHLGNQRPESY